MSNPKGKIEGEKMEQYSIRMTPSLWDMAMQKAGMVPLSAIIRKLLKLWIDGKIDIDVTRD